MKVRKSARERKRYVLFQGEKEDINRLLRDYLGIEGYSKASIQFIEDEVFAIERSFLTKALAAFEISDENLKVLGVSGTLKGIDKFRKV